MMSATLYLTSTGVGHPHPGEAIPEKNLEEWRCLKPLPPGLRKGVKGAPVTIGDVYASTAQVSYRHRAMTTPIAPLHKLAPGSWKVHYTMHTLDKCAAGGWTPSLTMANQSSEMKSQFQAKPDEIVTRLPDSSNDQPLTHTFRDHIKDQHTKALPASTVNRAAIGRPVVAIDQAVLDRLEPYLTTNHCAHRHFTSKELGHYPRKDVATYWQCENYPKAWGHGMDYNPLDREEDEKVHSIGPMRDRTVFSTATQPPMLNPPSSKLVSQGLRSLYTSSYTCPPDNKSRRLFQSTVPPLPSVARDTTQMACVPHMYEAINSTYGTPQLQEPAL